MILAMTWVPKIKHKIALRCNATGEVRIVECGSDTHDLEPRDFMWTEGNYSCDCNRHRFFQRAANVPEEEITDMTCNVGPNAYTAIYGLTSKGEVVAIDAEMTYPA